MEEICCYILSRFQLLITNYSLLPLRLAKFIAQTGYCARRKAEELILAGAVTVNGVLANTVTTFIDPEKDEVAIFGKPCVMKTEHVYIMANKPSGYLSTTANESRKKVTDILPRDIQLAHRLFLVGRLDRETEGLILMTDDGPMAQRMTHPSYEKEKEYEVIVRGEMTEEKAKRLEKGVSILVDEVPYITAPATLTKLKSDGKTSRFHLIIREGKKRQIRLMCEALGHPVRYLKRVRLGDLLLGDLPLGSWRHLTSDEIARLS